MKFRFFSKKKNSINIKEEWNSLGSKYASEVNEMVNFGETNGWDKWNGKEPEDNRDHLADEIFKLLKDANENNSIEQFRKDFPPAHTPLIKFFESKGQSIEQLNFIDNDKIIFLTGTAYQKRQAYILDGKDLISLESSIDAIGKSKKNNIFAIAANNIVTTTKGWQGEIIKSLKLDETKGLGISNLIPFNDGLKVLLISSDGIYILSEEDEKMIHPVPDLEDEEWTSYIDMENATLSNNNEYIVVGDQCSDHRILDQNGKEIGEIGPQSSYPHFCIFSDDDEQLLTNSCHFYNGISIGVSTTNINGLKVEAYEESDLYKVLDEEMRVYVGITTKDLYILGDAYGYVRAFNKKGEKVWRHYLGSTIGGLAISDDEKTLWIGSCTGMVHKLSLGKGHRDNHTLGNGNHYEEFRLILWKNEPVMWW